MTIVRTIPKKTLLKADLDPKMTLPKYAMKAAPISLQTVQ